jgi:flagellar basal-body rod protein FlgC
MDLRDTLLVSAFGMRAQSTRMRIIAENLANADSTAATPDAEPYRRQTVSFRNMLDRATGLDTVRVNRISEDPSPFGLRYDPGHPAANAAGYVRVPNVNSLIETMDMRQAQRSYEANMQVIEASKGMIVKTIDLLRA